MNTDFQGCTNLGSGIRRLEAQVVGINDKQGQDWRLLCETTPMTWNHTTYNHTTHCDERLSFTFSLRSIVRGVWPWKKIAMWDVPDNGC